MLLLLVFLCSTLNFALAVTVYGQTALGFTNAPAATAAAFNNTRLMPPAIPVPAPANAFTLTLQQDAAVVRGLSIPHVGGCLWGFSIEMSVISQILGKNSSYLEVPFLNLMSNLQERCGTVPIRLGGNTQEFAALVPINSIPGGKSFTKADSGINSTTQTPAVLYTIDMFYMMNNVSKLIGVKWFLGVPFNDSANWRLSIAEIGQQILGDNLLGLQAGNEPDLYSSNGHRNASYSPQDYSNDIGSLINAMEADPGIQNKNMLICPSVSVDWTAEQIWNTGFLDSYSDYLTALAVERYPNNNCAAQYNTNIPAIDPQAVFADYTTHAAVVGLLQPYINSTLIAQVLNKPFIMFETNTASCGGFPGISDSFGAALWATDYGCQLGYVNFTHGLLHTGGKRAYYNPFTAPPGNETGFHQWTVGAVYYSTIVLGEAFGTSNTSQIIDLKANEMNNLTPAYAIYEEGILSKVVLINYMDDDQRGTNDLQVTIQLPNGAPQSVQVKYLSATSVSDRDNIMWAGQTLGNDFTVDGRFRGELNVTTISCTFDACTIPVPSPGLALVFFANSTSSPPQDPYISLGRATKTFATTAFGRTKNTARVAPAVLATSNGHSGIDREKLGSTSSELKDTALLVGDAKGGLGDVRPRLGVLVGLVVGGVVAGRALFFFG